MVRSRLKDYFNSLHLRKLDWTAVVFYIAPSTKDIIHTGTHSPFDDKFTTGA